MSVTSPVAGILVNAGRHRAGHHRAGLRAGRDHRVGHRDGHDHATNTRRNIRRENIS